MTDAKRGEYKKALDLFLVVLETGKEEAKNLEVSGNPNGEFTVKFRKEI